jgi:glycogen synthase
MKILFLSNLFPPNQIGGYEVLCARVAGLIARRGHEVHVLTSCYGGKISTAAGMTVSQGLRLLCGDTIYQPFAKGDIRRQVVSDDNEIVTRAVVQRINPDVIFVWNLHGLQKEYFDMIGLLGIPVVCMLTDNWLAAMMAPDFIATYFKRHVYGDKPGGKLVPADTMRTVRASAIFGARYMQDLHAAAGLGFSNATVIHNGVDLSDQLTRPRKTRRDLINGADGPVRLLFAGRLVRLKGAHTVIEAMGDLKRRFNSLRHAFSLSMVGDGTDAEYFAHLKSVAEQLDLAEQITFMSQVPEVELPKLFDEHDIYVFPSLYEPFSLTLIHAMASGIPTVASAVGGNVEIIDDRRTGLTFAPGDAHDLAGMIELLATDAELREHVSVEGRAAAAQFTVTRLVDQMEDYLIQQAGR